MISENNLLSIIADDLDIQRSCSESMEKWKERVLYSTIGRMAYASLFDDIGNPSKKDESQKFVSITHFKRRIQESFFSWSEIYPNAFSSISVSGDKLSDDIYNLFLKTGYLYHQNNRIKASAPCSSVEGSVRFERGMPLNRKQSVSGLGGYTKGNEQSVPSGTLTPTLSKMFGFPDSSLEDQWEFLLGGAKWETLQDASGIQYLREEPPFRAGYWLPFPNQSGDVSVSRILRNEVYMYFLYQFTQRGIQISPIPLWFTNDPHFGHSSYRVATNSCLAAHHCLPAIQYHHDGSVVQLDLQYLLPPAELSWIVLYSWPKDRWDDAFRRIISAPLFYAIKATLEQLGYSFKPTNKKSSP